PASTFGPDSAAALAGRPLAETDRILEHLHNLHLLQEPSPERYVLHDLLREYAVDLVDADERDEALRRLVSFCLRTADRADRSLNPRRFRLPLPAQPRLPDVTLADELDWPDTKSVKAWLIAELPGLAAVENHARTSGMTEEAAWLAHVLAGHLETEGLWREAGEMHSAAADHWHTHGVTLAEAHALLALASIRIRTGQYPAATRAADRALRTARAEGDTRCTAEALEKLAAIHWHQSDLTTAASIQREVIEIHRNSADRWNLARCLTALGAILLHLGDGETALTSLTEARQLVDDLDDSRLELQILGNLGGLHLSTGNPQEARKVFERILSIGKEVLSPNDFATVQLNLAASLPLPDESARAATLYTSALETFRALDSRRIEADALNGLGTVHREAGDYAAALDRHSSALELARAIGAQREEAAALRGLGLAEKALDRIPAALDHLGRAAALARQIEAAEEEAYAAEALAELLGSI
ncbi:tetratricopeptide repeat protein, partial [Kitasatospora sp. NPDC093558]|uniref:tetratricopeptide repeat protein n=1 Tax=Kitasatospora sp. NPDC093558 TaxID=3155201 RepID=UPI0034188137